MNEAEEEDAMDVALREEKERQESSSNLEKASSSMSSSKGAVSSSSSASNDGEDELVNALRPFQNHAVSSRDGEDEARRDVDIVSSKRHFHLQEIISNDGFERGTCVAMGPLGVIAVGFADGTIRLTRAQHTEEKEEKKDSVPGMIRTIPAIAREEGGEGRQGQGPLAGGQGPLGWPRQADGGAVEDQALR